MLPLLNENQRPIQLIIEWSSIEDVLGLEGSLVRTSHIKKTIESLPGVFVEVQGRVIGRHQYDCRILKR